MNTQTLRTSLRATSLRGTSLRRTLALSAVIAAAGLALGTAQAAMAPSVTASQEASIHAGMSEREVRNLLGDPSSESLTPASTWTYDVAHSWNHSVFDVAFDGYGNVARVGERELPAE